MVATSLFLAGALHNLPLAKQPNPRSRSESSVGHWMNRRPRHTSGAMQDHQHNGENESLDRNGVAARVPCIDFPTMLGPLDTQHGFVSVARFLSRANCSRAAPAS